MANEKKLCRSKTDKVIFGVCGGLGEFFGISSLWFRIIFLLTLIPGGVPGILLYLIFWIVMPREE